MSKRIGKVEDVAKRVGVGGRTLWRWMRGVGARVIDLVRLYRHRAKVADRTLAASVDDPLVAAGVTVTLRHLIEPGFPQELVLSEEQAKELLEPHFFDLDEDLYGQAIEVELVSFLRDERRFDDMDALRAAMDEDAAEARRRLAR